MRKPGTLGLKKFLPGKLPTKTVLAQNIFIDFLAELDHSKIFHLQFFFVILLKVFVQIAKCVCQNYEV